MSDAAEIKVDVVVLGAGVAGMSAALFVALRGLSVLVLEKATTVGGTSAFSAGTAWIPGSMHAAAVNPDDTRDNVEQYLRNAVGPRLDEQKLDAFLSNGPRAVLELDIQSEVRFRARPHHPDYLSDVKGSTLCGRALEPLPFDGHKLGPLLPLLRPPLRPSTVAGMIVGADDIRHLLKATRSPASFMHATNLFARYAADLLLHGRGTRLLMGNAMCGRLLYSLRQRGVEIWTEVKATELLVDRAGVIGVLAQRHQKSVRVVAAKGVVLATGGFGHSERLQDMLLPSPVARQTAIPPEVTGDGIEMGLAAGATLTAGYPDGAFWSPVSLDRRRDGTTIVYPHFFLDRGKPGFLAVNRKGERFVNEATSYDAFVRAMYAADGTTPSIPCFLIADERAIRKYGMGLALPGGYRLRKLVRNGYIVRGSSLADLAESIGLETETLARTVTRFNQHARSGHDPDFERGAIPANLVLGDPTHSPNPCLGALEHAPFYALKIHPGINGTGVGLVTDEHARVLREGHEPIPGLYACGNDMTSLMAGTSPGPGITIGPAITFANIAARHIFKGGRRA